MPFFFCVINTYINKLTLCAPLSRICRFDIPINCRLQLRICKKNTNMKNEILRRKWPMYDACASYCGNSIYDIKLYQLWEKCLHILMTTNFVSNVPLPCAILFPSTDKMKVIYLVFLTLQLDGSYLRAACLGHFAAGNWIPLQIGLEGALILEPGKSGGKGKDFAFVKNRSPVPLTTP